MAKKPVLTEYNITAPDLNGNLTIALVSDLHDRIEPALVELVKSAEPDIIAVAGDTFERYNAEFQKANQAKKPNIFRLVAFNSAYYTDLFLRRIFCRKNIPRTEKTYAFLREISKIAPIYMSRGNHECVYIDDDFKLIEELKITLLDNSDVTLNFNGNKLIIGGLSTFYDEEWLKGYSEKDGFKILLSHHPAYYDKLIKDKDIDLVLSGHNHGGQIRIADRGIFSSGEGFLPKYDKGLYDGRLIVSAGCSNTVAVPRINNPREIVKVIINK